MPANPHGQEYWSRLERERAELLAALCEILPHAENAQEGWQSPDLMAKLERARAAIAKARAE